MHHKHAHHGPSPLCIIAFGVILVWLFGFKAFLFLPLLFVFGGFAMWACGTHNDEKPKRKSKPKRDTYHHEDDDDITYV